MDTQASIQRMHSLRHQHQHGRSRRRSDRPPSDRDTRRSRPQGDGEDTDADSSTGSGKSGRSGKDMSPAVLSQVYLETKTEMLGVIEDELKLKIEVKSIKEQFINLLQYYNDYQDCCDEWTESMALTLGIGHDPYLPRPVARCADPEIPDLSFTDSDSSGSGGIHVIHSAPNTTENSRMNYTEDMTTEGESIDVDADISVDVDADITHGSQQKKCKLVSDSDSVLPSSIDSDCVTDSDYKALKDISQITKCSDYSLYDPLSYSALVGPLHSTLNTTTASIGKPIDPNKPSQLDDERPSPMGMDDIHCHAPLISKVVADAFSLTPKAAAFANTTDTCSSLDESTPIIVTKYRRRTKRQSVIPGETPADDSGLCSYKGSSNTTEDTPTTIKKLSRDEYLALNEDGSRFAREGSQDDDTDISGTPVAMERRQVSGMSMEGLRQPGVGLSMGDLLGLVSWNADQDSISSSVEGTRASQASPSGLTLPSTCSDGVRSSSDMSSFQFSSMTTESSYKESDADGSSIHNLTSLQSPYPTKKHPPSIMHSTAMSTDSLSEPCAPMNSPNTTADDFSLSSRPVSNQSGSSRALTSASSQDNFASHMLGKASRPPCIGGERLRLQPLLALPGQATGGVSRPPLPGLPMVYLEEPVITPIEESDSDTGSDEIDVDRHTPRRTPQQATGMKRMTLMRRLRNFKRHFRANSRGRKSSGSSSKNTSKESR